MAETKADAEQPETKPETKGKEQTEAKQPTIAQSEHTSPHGDAFSDEDVEPVDTTQCKSITELISPAACLLLWYLQSTHLKLLNYILYIRAINEQYMDGQVKDAYLAFVILGMIAFYTLGGAMFLSAMKYASTREQEAVQLLVGVTCLFVASDLPIGIIEVTHAYTWGFDTLIQSLCLMITMISFFGGGFLVWFGYLTKTSSSLHAKFCDEPLEPGGVPRMAQVQLPQGESFFPVKLPRSESSAVYVRRDHLNEII